jgi:SPP1 family predicted phage head-tail adaptor
MPILELEAGTLDKRVTLLRPTYAEFEDEITGYESISDVWANVKVEAGREQSEAGRLVVTAPVTVTIRFRDDVDARCRVADGSHTYRIVGIADPARRKAQLVLSCEEIL